MSGCIADTLFICGKPVENEVEVTYEKYGETKIMIQASDEPISSYPSSICETPTRSNKSNKFHSSGGDTPDTSTSSTSCPSPNPPASPSTSSNKRDIVKEKSKALIKTAQTAINETTTAMIQNSRQTSIIDHVRYELPPPGGASEGEWMMLKSKKSKSFIKNVLLMCKKKNQYVYIEKDSGRVLDETGNAMDLGDLKGSSKLEPITA